MTSIDPINDILHSNYYSVYSCLNKCIVKLYSQQFTPGEFSWTKMIARRETEIILNDITIFECFLDTVYFFYFEDSSQFTVTASS